MMKKRQNIEKEVSLKRPTEGNQEKTTNSAQKDQKEKDAKKQSSKEQDWTQ